MLSDTSTKKGRSAVLGFHASAQTILQTVCPTQRKTGKCPLYNKECALRREIAKEMEDKIRKKALDMYNMQVELAEMEAELGEEDQDEQASNVPGTVFSVDPSRRETVLEQLILELKREPQYKNWSLDAAVAEAMVERGLRSCRYSHQSLDVMDLLKKKEKVQQQKVWRENEEEWSPSALVEKSNSAAVDQTSRIQHGADDSGDFDAAAQPSVSCSSAWKAPSTQQLEWDARRHYLFSRLTPIQKATVCLLWQQRCVVPLKVVCDDVREMLCQQEEDTLWKQILSTASPNGNLSKAERQALEERLEEELDARLQSAEFENRVEKAADAFVSHWTSKPLPLGQFDFSFFPNLLCHYSNYPTGVKKSTEGAAHFPGGLVLPITRYYFEGPPRPNPSNADGGAAKPKKSSHYPPLLPGKMTEKEIDYSMATQVELLLQCLEWLLHVYREEHRCAGRRLGHRMDYHGSCLRSLCQTALNHQGMTQGSEEQKKREEEALAALFDRLRWGIPASEYLFHQALGTGAVTRPLGKKTERQQEEEEDERTFLDTILPAGTNAVFRLHALTIRYCKMTNAEALISSLQKRPGLSSHLMALDLSHNRLQSLRFLYILRQHQIRKKDGADRSAGEESPSGSKPHTSLTIPLIRLSLKSNAITQKPDYQEQVRSCLPRLMALDGKKIRRQPLRLSNPSSLSATVIASDDDTSTKTSLQHSPSASSAYTSTLTTKECRCVVDFLERFTYMWETRYIPLTAAEREAAEKAGEVDPIRVAREKEESNKKKKKNKKKNKAEEEQFEYNEFEEQELDEENYPHRYHHPQSMFTFSLSPDLSLFSKQRMKLERDAEMEEMEEMEKKRKKKEERQLKKRIKREKKNGGCPAPLTHAGEDDSDIDISQDDEDEEEEGMPITEGTSSSRRRQAQHILRLSAQDYREAQLFSVSLKNSSRNLLQGRRALQQIARGAPHCYLAYISTIYPERLEVNHHLGGALMSIVKLGEVGKLSFQYIVQLHGIMSWTLPSMTKQLSSLGYAASVALTAAYDRTLVLVPRVLPRQNRLWEKRKGHELVILSDRLHLRRYTGSEQEGSQPYFLPQASLSRLQYYVLAWGLESGAPGSRGSGPRLVREVMERAGSDAALQTALDVLVFGLSHDPPLDQNEEDLDKVAVEEGRSHGALFLHPGIFSGRDEELDEIHETQAQKRVRKQREASVTQTLRQCLLRHGMETQESASSAISLTISSTLSTPAAVGPTRHTFGEAELLYQSSSIRGDGSGAGTPPHTVSLALIRDIVSIVNAHYAV